MGDNRVDKGGAGITQGSKIGMGQSGKCSRPSDQGALQLTAGRMHIPRPPVQALLVTCAGIKHSSLRTLSRPDISSLCIFLTK